MTVLPPSNRYLNSPLDIASAHNLYTENRNFTKDTLLGMFFVHLKDISDAANSDC
jgi:hypothetical protein